jgi:CheY-like chemotaxis protein
MPPEPFEKKSNTGKIMIFEELKVRAETTSIPVIFFSALQPAQVEEKAAQLGADGFISKSADPKRNTCQNQRNPQIIL